MSPLQDLRAGAREGTHLSRLGDIRSRLELFAALNRAKVRQEAGRALDRLRSGDPWEIARDAARDFIQRDCPGVAAWGLPEDFAADCHYATIHAAEAAVEAAGFDIEDAREVIADAVEHAESGASAAMEVGFEGGGSEDYAMAQAFYGPPLRSASIVVRRPVGHLHNRPRASHGKSIRRRGSRRGGGCSTRGNPGKSDDPDPESSSDVADPGKAGAFSAAPTGAGW